MQRLARAVPIAPHVSAYAVSLLAATHPDQPRAPQLAPRLRPLRRLAARRPGARRGRQDQRPPRRPVQRGDRRHPGRRHPGLRHRIILNFEGEAEGITTEAVIRAILDAVAPPTVE